MTEEQTKIYALLIPYFDNEMNENSIGLPAIAEQTGIAYGTVVGLFSVYIGRLSRSRRELDELRMNTCLSCGRLKNEVNDPAICRDIIHFL